RVFFFTGIPRKNSWIPPARMLDDFPVFSKEGIAWCLKNYGVSEVNNPSIPSDFSTVQRLFLKRLIYVPGVSRQGKVSLFKYVFGELYEPLRDFPFLIGGEDTFRKVEFHANVFFESTTYVCLWLESLEQAEPLDAELLHFFFSLIPHVDKRIFDLEIHERVRIDRGVWLDTTQSRLQKIMTWCFDYPDPTQGGLEGESRRRYLAEFRKRMDSLDHYPGELGQLWNS